jgi:uncharacterized protein (TIGR03435 family)
MRLVLAAVLISSSVNVTETQTPAGPAFEVASIKRNNSGSPAVTNNSLPGGRYIMTNAPVRSLILFAYPIPSGEIIGGPDWIGSERYDVNASAGRDATREELQAMVGALLSAKFSLVAHRETRNRPIYALRLARTDGRLGPDIRRTALDCDAVVAANKEAARGLRTPPPLASNGAPPCGILQQPGGAMLSGGITIELLAGSLSGAAGRLVVDKTGLAGNYEFTLNFAVARGNGNNATDDRPTLFTALREQLGLKLEPEQSPVETLVIDRIERPTPD